MRISFWIHIILMLVLTAPVALTKEDGDLVAEATYQTRENFRTKEGRRYMHVVGELVAAKFHSAMGECVQGASGKDLRSFYIFIRISTDGSVEKTAATPETRVASCFLRRISSDTYAKPPKRSYWVKYWLEVKKKKL